MTNNFGGTQNAGSGTTVAGGPWNQWDNWTQGGNPNVPPPSSPYAFNLGNFAGWGNQDFLWKLLAGSFPGALNSTYFTSGFAQPAFERAVTDAYNTLTPEGARARVAGYGRSQLESALSAGRQNAQTLADQGYSPSAQAGAMLDASNYARSRASDFAAQATDPYNVARQQMDLANTAAQSPALGQFTALTGAAGPTQPKQGNSFVDSLLGLAGLGTGLGLDWGKVFNL